MSDTHPEIIQIAQQKMIRADAKCSEIEERIAEYTNSQSYEIITQSNGKQTTRALKQPPIEIAILVGELLYQIRSTMDHLFFDLVKRNHGGGTTPRDRDIMFPICDVAPSSIDIPVPQAKFQSAARDCLSVKAFTFIESCSRITDAKSLTR